MSNPTDMECTRNTEYGDETEHQRSMCLHLPTFAGMEDSDNSETSNAQGTSVQPNSVTSATMSYESTETNDSRAVQLRQCTTPTELTGPSPERLTPQQGKGHRTHWTQCLKSAKVHRRHNQTAHIGSVSQLLDPRGLDDTCFPGLPETPTAKGQVGGDMTPADDHMFELFFAEQIP